MRLALLGFPKSWHNYQDSVNGRDNHLGWETIWSDLVHEEIRRNTRDGVTSKIDEQEKISLVGKGKKAKGKKAQVRKNPYRTMARRNNSVKLNAFTSMTMDTM